MAIFNALLNLSELKELYSGKPVCVCPLYKGVLDATKIFEATGNPITIPEYKSLVKLKTTFSPKQAGTGDPSPENVRPISGWDNVKVTVSNESESHDYDIALPETIYGGTVDAVTGEGSEEWKLVTLTGYEQSHIFSKFFYLDGFSLGEVIVKGVCSHYRYNLYQNDSIGINTTGTSIVYAPNGAYTLDQTGLDSWKSYLAAQASAGTPVQVAYKLANPEPFENSQVSIPSLKGENKFFTNGENMDIICKTVSFWGDGA